MKDTGTWLFVLPWALEHAGGVNQVVQNLFDANERVFRSPSLLLITSWDDPEPTFNVVRGRRTISYRMREPWASESALRAFLSFCFWFPRAAWRLRNLVANESIRFINIHYPGLAAITWALTMPALKSRVELVLSFHGTDSNTACRSTGISRLLWRYLLKKASSVIACSDGVRCDLLAAFPSISEKTHVIDNGVDPAMVTAAASTKSADDLPADYFLSLGTFEHKKGHDIALRAFAQIAERRADFEFVIAGRSGRDGTYEQLEEVRRDLPCAARVRLLKDVEHTTAMVWLRSARALVLASRDEPFGIVILEAGVLGRPVIATDVCGAIVRLPAEAMLVVRSEDPDQLAAAMDRLINDEALGRRSAAVLHNAVIVSFTWDRIVREYLTAMTEGR